MRRRFAALLLLLTALLHAEDSLGPGTRLEDLTVGTTTYHQVVVRSVNARTLVITPDAALTAAPDLGQFPARLRTDGDLAVEFKTGQASVEQVLSAVRAGGVKIKDLKTEQPDLEDVFLSLTYENATAADPLKD